jgi:hypothetical protein
VTVSVRRRRRTSWRAMVSRVQRSWRFAGTGVRSGGGASPQSVHPQANAAGAVAATGSHNPSARTVTAIVFGLTRRRSSTDARPDLGTRDENAAIELTIALPRGVSASLSRFEPPRSINPTSLPSSQTQSPTGVSERFARLTCIAAIKARASASSAYSSLENPASASLSLPLAADFALPSGVRGPVENRQGLWASAAARTRSTPSADSPLRSCTLRWPAATRFGFFGGELDEGAVDIGSLLVTTYFAVGSRFPGFAAGPRLSSRTVDGCLASELPRRHPIRLEGQAKPSKFGQESRRQRTERPGDLDRIGVRRLELQASDVQVCRSDLLDQHHLDRVRGCPRIRQEGVPEGLDGGEAHIGKDSPQAGMEEDCPSLLAEPGCERGIESREFGGCLVAIGLGGCPRLVVLDLRTTVDRDSVRLNLELRILPLHVVPPGIPAILDESRPTYLLLYESRSVQHIASLRFSRPPVGSCWRRSSPSEQDVPSGLPRRANANRRGGKRRRGYGLLQVMNAGPWPFVARPDLSGSAASV